MKTWNKKHKPKHWTTPHWRTGALKTSRIICYHLTSRGIKDKYENDNLFSAKLNKLNNKPKHRFLVSSKKGKLK